MDQQDSPSEEIVIVGSRYGALATLSFMNEDARYLDKVRFSRDDEPVFMQMRDVVNALRAELVKIHMKR